MRDHERPELRDYLTAERGYYDAHAALLSALAGRLAAESTGRIPDRAEDSVGWPLSGFIYRTRTPQGRENLQFLRSQSGESGEQLLLDENIVGAETGYVDVGAREPSPDGSLLAWSADSSGAEIYRLRIRDLSNGADLPDDIERSYPGIAWSADSRYLFYLVPDELNRPFQVWRHQVGTPGSDDALVLTEDDDRYEMTLHASRSGGFAVITSACRDTTEVRLIPLADPLAEPIMVEPRRRGVEYRVDHARSEDGGPGWLYIVTDDGEPEFTLKRVRADAPGAANWAPVACQEIAPLRGDTRLHGCDVIGDRLLLTLRRDGAPLLAVTDLDGGNVIEVPSAFQAGSISVEHAEDYDAGSVIVMEESLIEPPTWSRLDLATGERTRAQAQGGARLRRVAIRDGAGQRPCEGWAADSRHARLRQGHAAGRHPLRACSTATARTSRARIPSSASACLRCSIAASSTRSRTSGAAARAAGTGGSRAGCAPSRPRSPTSSTWPTG